MKKRPFALYGAFASIVLGVAVFITGFTIFWLGFHNNDIAWNLVIFRDFFNANTDTPLSWEDWGDNTSSGYAPVKEIYKLSLAQLQVGLFFSLIGIALLFLGVGYLSSKTYTKR